MFWHYCHPKTHRIRIYMEKKTAVDLSCSLWVFFWWRYFCCSSRFRWSFDFFLVSFSSFTLTKASLSSIPVFSGMIYLPRSIRLLWFHKAFHSILFAPQMMHDKDFHLLLLHICLPILEIKLVPSCDGLNKRCSCLASVFSCLLHLMLTSCQDEINLCKLFQNNYLSKSAGNFF